MRDITLSIVSHAQNALVNDLLVDIERTCAHGVSLVITQNVPDPNPLHSAALSCPVRLIANDRVKGFGTNHNAAFAHCRTTYFCVCNPDIRLQTDPFPAMLAAMRTHTGVVGPLVRNPAGSVEDSARRFPTIASLAGRLFTDKRGPDYPTDQGTVEVDWIGGMFMLFKSNDYRAIGGFDESYFLYYEDVDLCHRLRAAGRAVVYEPAAAVVHAAQRASRRNPALGWQHLKSALRFLSRR